MSAGWLHWALGGVAYQLNVVVSVYGPRPFQTYDSEHDLALECSIPQACITR